MSGGYVSPPHAPEAERAVSAARPVRPTMSEREMVIRFGDDEAEAHVWTNMPAVARRLAKIGATERARPKSRQGSIDPAPT